MSKVNYKKLGKDTVAFGLSSMASKVMAYFLLPIYTAVLSTEEFGFADTLLTLVNLLYPILTFAISEALLRFTMDTSDKLKRNEYVTATMTIVGIATLLLLAAGYFVKFFNTKLYSYWIYVVLLFLGFNFEKCTAYYTKAIGKTRLVALAGVFHTMSLIVTNILLLVVFKVGILGYIWAMIFSYFATSCFHILGGKLWRYAGFSRVKRETFAIMLRYSTPMIVTIMAWWLNTTSNKYIIEFSLGISARGLYAAAYKIPTIISSLTNIFIDAWKLTMYSSNKDEVDGSFYSVYKNLGKFTALIVIVLSVASELVGKIMFSKDYFSAWKCIPFLAAAVYFSTLTGYLASAITKSKATSRLLVGTLIGASLNIALGILLVPKYGIVAAAITTYLGFMVSWLIRMVQVRKIVEFKINLRTELLNVICITAMAVIMSFNIPNKYFIALPIFIIAVINNFGFIKDVFIMIFSFINKSKSKE